MVASLVLNRPTRVFARLTHTGENKTAEPVCCDLSRMASILPANPLPKNLAFPHVVDSNTVAPSDSKLVSPSFDLCAEKTTAGKRKREEGDKDAVQAPTDATQGLSVAREGRDVPPAKIAKLDPKSAGSENNDARTQGKVLSITEASQLLAENEKLKIENEALKDKLTFLHMILQKAENYNSLAKTKKEYQKRQPMQQGSK